MALPTDGHESPPGEEPEVASARIPEDPETIALLALAAHIFLVGVAAVLVSMNRRPSSAIAWVLAIIFIPLLGAVAFFFVGNSKLPKGRRDKQQEVNDLVLARTEGSTLISEGLDWPEWLHSVVALNSNLGALPMVKGNSAELLPDYNGTFDAMIAEIESAAATCTWSSTSLSSIRPRNRFSRRWPGPGAGRRREGAL